MICSVKNDSSELLSDPEDVPVQKPATSDDVRGEETGFSYEREGRLSWQQTEFPEAPDVSKVAEFRSEPMPRRQLRERFEALARTWRNECRFSSSMTEIAMHPAYQQIIGMGRDAVEFLLQELDRQPDHWFWALCAITGEDPVPPEDKGDLAAMAKVWLHWGKEHHYV